MKEIIRADILGFCMGVRRAMEMAEQARIDFPIHKIFTLGPLIHNPSALDTLQKKGIFVLKESDIPFLNSQEPTVVIIRAHGVPPKILAQLEEKNVKIINATCPRVQVSQKRAKDFSAKGYAVIIAGDKNHGEVTGIAGFASRDDNSTVILVGNSEDAEKLTNFPNRAILISQTTISQSEYDSIAAILSKKIPDLTVFNTICPATIERQQALKELAAKVDGILVIGGKESANTHRLLMTAKTLCKKAALIENSLEIPFEFFSLAKVGLTAGASTPDDVIDMVEDSLINVNNL